MAWVAVVTAVLVAAAPQPVDVEFTTSPPVVVRTDGVAAHWRRWQVVGTGLSRGERCRFRIDASRALRHKPVTQALPRRCMTRFDRAQSPDPKP